MKKLIIDQRMRNIEKQTLTTLGYELIEIKKNNKTYPEISSHVDIFACKVKNKIIAEKHAYDILKNQLEEKTIIQGATTIQKSYPNDICYNTCIVGNKAIHNFKYTDSNLVNELKKQKFKLINVKQGYSNCSIAVIDENSIILSDRGLYNSLKNNGLDILFLDYTPDIKLFNENGTYSTMSGIIGGAIASIGNNVVIFGELNKIDHNNQIRNFIKEKRKDIIEFKELDVLDYGGIIEI